MSNLRSLNSEKQESVGATIGFRFHANDEELEEVQLAQGNPEENSKPKTDVSATEVLDSAISETVKDQKNLLGKRSSSVDSAYESPFSNPSETWKKLNVLKDKITKTVEEKILEKIDRNVLSKSGRNRLSQSKENSSISDSEDTSESSKLSDHLRNAGNQTSTPDKTSNEDSEININTSDPSQDIKNQSEWETKETENELRNRKNFTNFSEIVNLPVIKIATAKTDIDRSLISQNDESLTDVESGVEADENLDITEDLLDLEDSVISSAGGSNTPPYRENIMKSYCYRIITKTTSIAFLLGVMFYFLLPLSEFFRGFLLCVLMVLFWELIGCCTKADDPLQQQKSFAFPNFKSMPPLKVPKSKIVKGIWFNEYEEENYDPDTYSITQTVPAYLELENSILKISRPKGKVRRRATYDEPEYKLPIISERVFNICGCNVYLLPDGLTRKRLFSKKYPIVIFLKPDSLISEKKHGKEVDEKGNPEETEIEEHPCSVNPESPKNKCTLYLFARCDRQKEEWYRKLMSATRGNHNEKTPESCENTEKEGEKTSNEESPTKESCTPFETLFFDNEEGYLEEYSQYMASFVQSKFNRSTSFPEGLGKDQEGFNYSTDQVQWLNAFLNRILFDVFRSPHWHSKIQEKVYRKLNSIRLPYYIENIEVVELDLGKTGPMFHRVSQPYMDECGLWFDMDLTFDGLIRLTIQTHLNLIKLQKGVEENEETTPLTNEKPKKEMQSHRTEKESLVLKEPIPMKTSRKTSKFENKNQIPKSQISITEPKNKVYPSEDFPNNLLQEVAEFAHASVEHSLKTIPERNVSETDNIVPSVESSKERSAIYDSELEDSAESSDEDEEEEDPPPSPVNEEPASESFIKRYPKSRRSSKKIFQVFENVARSKYFRSMAQSKYIQKAIAGVSAAKLRLTLEVKSCNGIVAVNIPPPPSDRFWFGFREMPKLVLSANPKIGDKAVRFIHIKNYLQKKILHELKKVLVVPNMIDFVLPTSPSARSSSFVHLEEQEDLEEATLSE